MPLSTRDSVTRVTRRCAAAVDTAMFPMYSRSASPGCGGLCMPIGDFLVIILAINQDHIPALKPEGQPPAAYPNRPVAPKLSRQGMQLPSGSVHVARPLGIVEGKQLQAQLGGVLRLNPRLRPGSEKLLYAPMSEALNHIV